MMEMTDQPPLKHCDLHSKDYLTHCTECTAIARPAATEIKRTHLKPTDPAPLTYHSPPLSKEAHCIQHGPFTSRCFISELWTKCPRCVADQQAAFEQQEKDELIRKAIKNAGIPPRFQNCSFDNYNADTQPKKEALDFCKEIVYNIKEVSDDGRCAIFLGSVGTGKTHLACAIATELIKNYRYRSICFTTVQNLLSRIKASWKQNADETEHDVINKLSLTNLLILDEVGVQYGTDFEKQILFQIFNYRYEHKKPTILISNVPTPELERYLGKRVIDRIKENMVGIMTFVWESHRSNQ